MLTVKEPALSKRRTSPVLAGLLFLLLFEGVSWAEIIPSSRTAPWQGNVGVPGGIPTRTTIYRTLSPVVGDNGPRINEALKACPANQVVQLAAGTFNINGTVGTFKKSNITLRGAGQGQTILKLAAGSTATVISIRGYSPWPPPKTIYPITGGATKGSNTITVGNTVPFTPNATMVIATQPVPSWGHNLGFRGSPAYDSDPTYGITFRVVSKTHTTVTFEPACPYDFTTIGGRQVVAIPYTDSEMVSGVGIESLSIECEGSKDFSGIQMEQVYGCWIKDVELAHSYSRQFYFLFAIRNEVRQCYTHDVQAVGPNHEGIAFNADSSWNLIEDNICNAGGAPPIEFSDGTHHCSCNVAAYNYCVNTDPNFWDISMSHGSGGMFNLIEGNVFRRYEDDGYFGGSAYGTLFRNSIAEMVLLKHFTVYYNFVGNVLGLDWPVPSNLTRVYETEKSNYWSGVPKGEFPIYELGFPNIGNPSHDGTSIGPTNPPDYARLSGVLESCQQLDRNVKGTILRHGNWDAAHKGVVWDASISDHTIPNSLYLTGKPSWWGDLPWPPIGPDRSPMVGLIPAQKRFETRSLTPTSGPTATVAPITTTTPSATPSSTQSPQVKKNKKKLKTWKWGRAKKNSGNEMPEGQEDSGH